MGPDPIPSDGAPSEPTDAAAPTNAAVRPKRRPRFWVLLALGVVVLAAVVTGIVVTVSVFTARGQLDAAVALAPKLEDAVRHGDTAEAGKLAVAFEKHTSSAADATHSPFWSIGEVVPGLGPNLVAVRTVAETAEGLGRDAVIPASRFSIHSLKPSGGGIDLKELAGSAPLVHSTADAVNLAVSRIHGIKTAGLLAPVATEVAKLDSQLTSVKTLADGLDASIDLLPKAFGSDGPRHYLLVFQNNAEARALGGNPAALLEVTVDDGQFTVTRQASSADFHHQANIPVSPAVSAVYGDVVGQIIQNSTMVPDFPTVAGYAKSFWAERYGTQVDGVVSFDPVALSYLLKAIGPVTLDTGDVLNSDNAVKLLLSTVYDRYRIPADQDAFFASVASSMFTTLVSGKGEFNDIADELSRSINSGRLLLWSGDSAEQSLVAEGRLAGMLPADNTSATTVGAWVNDFTFAKMDYYVDSKVTAQPSCGADPYSVSMSLKNTAPAGVGVLPPYVTGPIYPDGVIHTDVVLTGPVGSTLVGVQVDGSAATPAGSGVIDGRPVVRTSITIAPGTQKAVTATFAPVAGASSTLVVRSTPMVRDTVTAITPCG